jgi:hypothetical protein
MRQSLLALRIPPVFVEKVLRTEELLFIEKFGLRSGAGAGAGAPADDETDDETDGKTDED